MEQPQVDAGGARCAYCGAPYEPDQEYCLDCGARLPGARIARGGPPLWIWVTVVAVLVMALAGAIAAALTADGADSSSVAASSVQAETATEPQTVTLGPPAPVTEPVPEPVPSETGGTGTVTPPAGTGLVDWPAGTDGFTAVLASVPSSRGPAAADAVAESALAAGLPQIGVLDSSQYATLRPGFWVVFSGVYTTADQARAGASAARSAGFADAYPREVAG